MKIEDYKASGVSTAYDIVKESIKYEIISAYMWSAFLLIGIFICIFFSFKFYNIKYEKSYDRPIIHCAVWFISLFCVPLSIFQLYNNIDTLLAIKIAPKYYITKKFK